MCLMGLNVKKSTFDGVQPTTDWPICEVVVKSMFDTVLVFICKCLFLNF